MIILKLFTKVFINFNLNIKLKFYFFVKIILQLFTHFMFNYAMLKFILIHELFKLFNQIY